MTRETAGRIRAVILIALLALVVAVTQTCEREASLVTDVAAILVATGLWELVGWLERRPGRPVPFDWNGFCPISKAAYHSIKKDHGFAYSSRGPVKPTADDSEAVIVTFNCDCEVIIFRVTDLIEPCYALLPGKTCPLVPGRWIPFTGGKGPWGWVWPEGDPGATGKINGRWYDFPSRHKLMEAAENSNPTNDLA